MTGVAFVPIRRLSAQIRSGRVSPVEVAEHFLERMESLGPRYNAVVTLTRERALRQARRAESEIAAGDYRGPLHGVPYGAKDLFATSEGIPTTWGAAPFRDQVFDYDAAVIRALERAGAVLVAKLAMIELAGGMGYNHPDASFTGPCSSPWSRSSWSGGSSSGSGAAVAAGLVPFALGTETWGSIMSPANNCGVAGLRPTFGRVSRHGAMAACWSLDKAGPLCLTADDCGLVLDAIAGHDPLDPSTVEREFRYEGEGPSGGFRLAVLEGAADAAQPAVRVNFERALDELRRVATIEQVSLPDLPYEAVMRTILHAETASAFDDFIASGRASELTAPSDRAGVYARTMVLARDYIRAQRSRELIVRAADDLLADYDALVAPTSPSVAPPIDAEFSSAIYGARKDLMGSLGNAAGVPSISVPSGFDEAGLPTGIQFMGRAYEENAVIAVARTYQSMTDWHEQHPPDTLPA